MLTVLAKAHLILACLCKHCFGFSFPFTVIIMVFFSGRDEISYTILAILELEDKKLASVACACRPALIGIGSAECV